MKCEDKDPYWEGYSSGYDDEEYNCPYPNGSIEAMEWDKGYWIGCDNS
jgi:hypothetical protein